MHLTRATPGGRKGNYTSVLMVVQKLRQIISVGEFYKVRSGHLSGLSTINYQKQNCERNSKKRRKLPSLHTSKTTYDRSVAKIFPKMVEQVSFPNSKFKNSHTVVIYVSRSGTLRMHYNLQ
jgi:hypothetical protein